MSKLADALRKKFKSPREAIAALGLDTALLGDNTEDRMRHLSTSSAQRIADELKAKGKLAMDADPTEVTRLLLALDAETESNAGTPAYLRECEDEEEKEDSEEERREDEEHDRRARDARRRRMGRDETEEEEKEREEREEGEDRRRARDRRGRARDESEEEREEEREEREEGEDRRRSARDTTEEEEEERSRRESAEERERAEDRRRLGRDYRRARDAHHKAMDAHRRTVGIWRRAHDAHKAAMDANDSAAADRCSKDMAEAAADARNAYDEVMRARDRRHHARDARRLFVKRIGRDEPPKFPGRPNPGGTMEPISKAAMDAAIEVRVADALRANDQRHREVADAMRAVRPKVGELAMDQVRSAADVYSRALTVMGIDHAGISETAALRRLYEVAARPGTEQRPGGFALDTAPADARSEFAKWFPNAAQIERI